MRSLPLCPGHTGGLSDFFARLNSEFKPSYITSYGPLKKKQPKSTTDKSIMCTFNGLLLLISPCDMSQGSGSFPVVCSASTSAHVATRTEICLSVWFLQNVGNSVLGEQGSSERSTERGKHRVRIDIKHALK